MNAEPTQPKARNPQNSAVEADATPQRTRARSFFESFGMWVLGAVAALAGSVVQARALGPAGRGDVVFLTVLVNLTAYVAMFGVQHAHANILGQEREKARTVLTNSLVMALALGLGFALLAAALLAVVPMKVQEDVGWTLTAVALACAWALVLQMYLRWLAITEYRFRLANGTLLLVPAMTLVVNLGLALAGALTVTLSLLAWVGGQLLATAILMVWSIRHIGFGRFSLPLARRAFTFGAKNHLSATMQLANFRLDQLFVGGIGGAAELGTYSVAVAWAESLFFMPEVLSQVQRPDLVRASRKSAAEDAAFGMRVAVIGTAICAVAVIVAAPLLVDVIFGEDFGAAVSMLRVLAVGAIGIAVSKLLATALVSQNHPLATAGPNGAALLVTVVLDILLIPLYGGDGAAIASLAAYVVGGLAMAAVFLRVFGERVALLMPHRGDVAALWAPVAKLIAARRSRGDAGSPIQRAESSGTTSDTEPPNP
jgi:O-antigen/teichoic acid export membrane protein